MSLATESRKGEDCAIPNRAERFFQLNSDWFFATREGALVGPFTTNESANSGLNDYLDFIRLSKPRVRRVLEQAYSAH